MDREDANEDAGQGSAKPPAADRRNSLDEALARRRAAEHEKNAADREFARSRQEKIDRVWAVIDDFRSREVPPGHALVHAWHRHEYPRFRRPRFWTETEPLGEGWWAGSNSGDAADHDIGSRWRHEATFLLTTGDLVTGKTVDLWGEHSPTARPAKFDIELYGLYADHDLIRVRHRENSPRLLRLSGIADALARYL
jgi:hypothetical protein